MPHLDLGPLARDRRLRPAVRQLVAAATHRLIGAPLVRRIHDLPDLDRVAAGGRMPSLDGGIRAIVDDTPRLRRLVVDAVVAALASDLDQLFAREDLARGRPFGTRGYETALADLCLPARPARRAADPAALWLEVEAAEATLRGVLQRRTGPWSAAAPPPASAIFGFWRRRRRIEAAWARLDAALGTWAGAHVGGQVDAAVDLVLAWLEAELRRRIHDRRAQRDVYAAAHLRDAHAGLRALRRRPAYAGQPAGDPRPGARLPLRGIEWGALAARLARAEPHRLLATFAREAARHPAAIAALARADAGRVRAAFRAWLRARIAARLTVEGGLEVSLGALPEHDRALRVRSLADAASNPLRLRPGADAAMDLVAGIGGRPEAVRLVADQLGAEAPLEELVETGCPERVDVVAVSRGWLSAADITDTRDQDARRLRRRLDQVHRELHSPQLALIAAECGMVEALFGDTGAAGRADWNGRCASGPDEREPTRQHAIAE